jgi:putative peptidoglycan lipid II flippase
MVSQWVPGPGTPSRLSDLTGPLVINPDPEGETVPIRITMPGSPFDRALHGGLGTDSGQGGDGGSGDGGSSGWPGDGFGGGPDGDGGDGGHGPGDGRHAAATGPTGGVETQARRTSRLLSGSAVMAAGTLVSRILGMLRVAVLGWAIGVGFYADPFAVANTLPNSLFILIGGGVLNAVLVPQIVRAAKHSDGGQEYIDRLVTLSIVVLGGATVLATALAPVLIRVYEGGWHAEQVSLGTGFALWCLPQIFFYGLYTIYGQILNARNSFGPYMWAPAVNNVVAIAGCLVFIALYGGGGRPASWWGAGPITVLAGTATAGVIAQALVLLPALSRVGYRWRPRWGFRGFGMRTAGRVAGWTFGGVLIGQLAFVLISKQATYGAAAAIGTHGTADRGRAIYDNAYLLFFLPHSLVAVSLVTAVFTRMAAAAGAGRTDEVRADTSLAVRLTGVATVLATVAFVVLGRDLARAVFFRNAQADTDGIALVTGAMILGLVAFSAMYLFQRVYYAYEDARTPFWIQVVVVVIWTSGSLLSAAVLPPAWVTPGIGLAMSASNLVGAVISAMLLRRRIGGLDGARVLRTHIQLVVAAVAAGVAGWLVDAGVHAAVGFGRLSSYLALLVAGVTMIAVYGTALRVMRVQEFDLLMGPVQARLRKL